MTADVTSPRLMAAEKSPAEERRMYISSGKLMLQRLALGLVPSFVQHKLVSSKSQRLHPTSYLDGLRGVASFIVFMGHYTEESVGWWTEPYGAFEDRAPSSPLQLPFVRVIYSPRPMVHIFFIISGYVLSYKPLKQIHTQQYSALASTISSSIFRRGLRLFLPSIVALLIMAFAVSSGLSSSKYAAQLPSIFSQLAHWLTTCWKFMKAAWLLDNTSPPMPKYNPALWTIPVEFNQSLLLFTVIMGLSRCIASVRLSLLACIIVFCFRSGQLFAVEFLGGMFLAEITLFQDRSLFTPTSSPSILPTSFFNDSPEKGRCSPSLRHSLSQAFWIANLICGLYISSWTNNHIGAVWGLRFLDKHTPEPYSGQRVWFLVAAFQIVGACTQVRALQNIFTSGIAQYLGNISYALYLTHNLCLTILEPRLFPLLQQRYGTATFWGRHLCWGVGLVFILPVLICVADLFWRVVDIPTVKLARWVETKCLVTMNKT